MTQKKEKKPTHSEWFDPRPLSVEFRRIGGEFWECRVSKSGPFGRQPFAGAHAWARSKAQSREHLMTALRTFTAADAKTA